MTKPSPTTPAATPAKAAMTTTPAPAGNALDGLTPAQQDRVATLAQSMRDNPRSPAMHLTQKDGVLSVRFDCESQSIAQLLTMADLGTADTAIYGGIIGQIAALGAHGRRVDNDNSNFVLAVVRSVQPRDDLEALLATQMGAIHAATMMMARRFNHVETIPQQDAAERALNKLARTFAVQMETLKRYRTGGQQRVTVEHVTVNAGGQAIVGAVAAGGGGPQ
jgi:hypothetical protein